MRYAHLGALLLAFCSVANAQPVLVLADDFEDGDANGWVSDCLGSPGDCSWSVTSGFYTGSTIRGATSVSYVAEALDYCDYTYEVDVRAESGADKIMVGRYTDTHHYYYLNVRSSDETLWLRRTNGTADEFLSSARIANVPGQWYRLRMEFLGQRVRCYVDDVLVVDVIDSDPVLCGAPGVWCEPNQRTSFDNVAVYADGFVPVATIPWGALKTTYRVGD